MRKIISTEVEFEFEYSNWIRRGVAPKDEAETIEFKLAIKKYLDLRSDYVDREIKRMLDERLIRNPMEQYRMALRLSYFESNIKSKEKSFQMFYNW